MAKSSTYPRYVFDTIGKDVESIFPVFEVNVPMPALRRVQLHESAENQNGDLPVALEATQQDDFEVKIEDVEESAWRALSVTGEEPVLSVTLPAAKFDRSPQSFDLNVVDGDKI